MAARQDLRALNQALSQADRIAAFPAPDAAQVDGRTLIDLLAFAADYGTLITFYDLTDTPEGDWSAFFRSDPSIAIAARLALDREDIQQGFDRVLAALRAAESEAAQATYSKQALTGITRMAEALTNGAGRGRTDTALAALVVHEQSALLAEPARRVQRQLLGAPAGNLADGLDALTNALLTALDQSDPAARAALAQSLETGAHPAQGALYDAFAVLFGHSQAALNRFPERLARFYREDVLRQTRRDGRPDSVVLTFTPAKDLVRAELPRGTLFDAGTDKDGATIAYALDNALSVDAAAVAALRTLRTTTQLPHGTIPALAAQVLSGTVTLADTAPRIADPFPLLGAAAPGTDGALVTTPASMGFALASPTLMLTGGTRCVTLDLTLSAASCAAVWGLCEAIGAGVGLAPETVFTDLMCAAFALRYSTATGWAAVADYQVTAISATNPLFQLSFVLDPDAEPFVAQADADSPHSNAPVLVVRLLQQPVLLGDDPVTATEVFPYAIVSPMVLDQVLIKACVSGLADLTITTPGGPADIGQPFALFGSPPVVGATMGIAATELFVKTLISFTLNMIWAGLPVTTTGFRGYYQAYVVDADGNTVPPGSQYDNASFQAGITVANPGTWDMTAAANPLFDSDEVGTLRAAICFTPAVAAATPGPYYDPALSAVNLTLTAPSTAFGDVLYGPNVMAASLRLTATASACAQQCGETEASGTAMLAGLTTAVEREPGLLWGMRVQRAAQRAASQITTAAASAPPENASAYQAAVDAVQSIATVAKQESAAAARPVALTTLGQARADLAVATSCTDCVDQCMAAAGPIAFPNVPWLPTVADLTVDYEAVTSIPAPPDTAPGATLFHLCPFDTVQPVAWDVGTAALLAPIAQAGALMIGLSAPAQDLALLIQLAPPPGGWPTLTPPVAWALGDGTRWTPITPLHDTTDDLRISGLIGFSGATPFTWLRAGVETAPGVFPDLAAVVANAGTATWVGPGGGATLATPLPAGTITAPATARSDLDSVDQPMPSSGGAPILEGAAFGGWLAERLRHKNRAIQDWDYATLLLAAFPSLWQVAVVPASDGGTRPAPGHVWVMPIPGPETPAIADRTAPSNDAQMLSAIQSYLAPRISGFVTLHVGDPHYVRLVVTADLVFTNADSAEGSAARLNDELIAYLSPWPTPALGPRSRDYYTLREVAHFIRSRPYVRAIRTIALAPQTPTPEGWHYLTSALAHAITGKAQAGDDPALQGSTAYRMYAAGVV